jgi:hypothetical protein
VLEPVLIVRIGLALVFSAAAAGKLAGRSGPEELLERFELGRRLAPAVSALPFAELAVAAGLLVASSARLAAMGSCLLLAAFSWLLYRRRRHGGSGSCNCFGSLGPSPIDRYPLTRNAVLYSASLLVALWPAQAPLGLLTSTVAGHELIVAAVALLAGACCLLARRLAVRVRRRRQGLAAASVTTLAGAGTTLGSLFEGGTAVLVFVDPECAPCRSVVPALRQLSGGSVALRSPLPSPIVVSHADAEPTGRLLAGVPADRVLLDPAGSLAAACGVHATPTIAVVRAGLVESLTAGTDSVNSLLDPAVAARLGAAGGRDTRRSVAVPRGPRARGRTGWTRREALTAAMTAAGVVITPRLTPLDRLGKSARHRAGAAGAHCPSCGSCVVCEVPGPSTTKLSCRPCAKKCSANQLCTGYANEFADYQQLAGYLADHGYAQSGEPAAGGLERGDSLAYLGLLTTFSSASPESPKAVLTYGLTSSGQSASLAMLDPKGRITTVVTVEDGQLVSVAVPVEPALPAATATNSDDEAVLEVASCADTCKQIWDVVLLATTPLLEGELLTPAGWGLALGSFLFDQIVLGPLQSQITNLGTTGTLVNAAINHFAGKTSLDKLEDQVGNMLCQDFVCKLQLKGCCNYTGACFDSDAVCEQHCPGGLAHPLAHCDVYINGLKVSTLISP